MSSEVTYNAFGIFGSMKRKCKHKNRTDITGAIDILALDEPTSAIYRCKDCGMVLHYTSDMSE